MLQRIIDLLKQLLANPALVPTILAFLTPMVAKLPSPWKEIVTAVLVLIEQNQNNPEVAGEVIAKLEADVTSFGAGGDLCPEVQEAIATVRGCPCDDEDCCE